MSFKDFKLNEEELKISLETAEKQMAVFLQHYRIAEETISNEELKKACDMAYDRLVVAIRQGSLTIEKDKNGELLITHIRKDKENITYAEITGAAKVQDEKYSSADVSNSALGTQRLYSVMASLANLGLTDIMKFKGMDLSIVESLGFFILNV